MTDLRPLGATARLLDAVANGIRVYDLARPMFVGMPQSPNHPPYGHTLPRRHGDKNRSDGASAANDLIVTGTHVGTHIDALSHVSQDGYLHGGVDAINAQNGGRFEVHGVHTIEPMVCRGVLLDIPAALGQDMCDADHEVTPEELDSAVARQGVDVRPGDVVLVYTGWGRTFDEGDAFVGRDTGVPGVGEAGATWLVDRRIRAAGAETVAFEYVAPREGHSTLPAHRVLLVEHGIYIIETLDLEELARDAVHEFLFVLAPLKLVGATGSPVRPLAIVSDA